MSPALLYIYPSCLLSHHLPQYFKTVLPFDKAGQALYLAVCSLALAF